MKISIELIDEKSKEQVIIECTQVTSEIKRIKSYIQMNGNTLDGLIENRMYQLNLNDVYYFEAVGEKVFAYTQNKVYEVKKRLYELEEAYSDKNFIRCSKSFIINLMRLECISPEINGRFIAHLKNGEKVIISRYYVSGLKKAVMG